MSGEIAPHVARKALCQFNTAGITEMNKEAEHTTV